MTGAFVILLGYLAIILLDKSGARHQRLNHYTNASPPPHIEPTDTVYHGQSNEIGLGEIQAILEKHHSYYLALHPELKEIFLKRAQKFMCKKTFIIKEIEGFREMPVLISASAIQLTFGLKKYLLPFYKYIRIYPKEYLGDDFLKILAGNVHHNIITVAWNHFLHGNKDHSDGSNLGLHEMSHALYFQKVIIDGKLANDFCRNYNYLTSECRVAHQAEINEGKNIYSEYAEADLQEFWAESVELFFEKPQVLYMNHPAVYEAMKILLRQDPLEQNYRLAQPVPSFTARLQSFLQQ